MKERFKKIWAHKWLRWVLILVVIAVVAKLLFGGTAVATYETIAVTRGTVIESVTATGQIKPEQYASLRFKTAGSIARMNVDVGSRVVAGQVLAVLDTSDLSKKVTQAEADLVVATVAFANAQQEVVDQQTRGDQAATVLYAGAPNTLNEVLNLVQQAYSSFATFYDTTGHLMSAVANPILISQRVVDADNAKGRADVATQTIVATLENFPAQAGAAKIDATLIEIHEPLQQLQASLTSLINAVAAIPSGSVPAATLSGYKDTLAAARTNMNSAISKESALVSDLRDIGVQNTLTRNTALASERSAGANVEKAKAALEIAQQSLSDAYLRAPFSGTIAVKGKQTGEFVTTSDQVFYLIGEGGLEIVANIPEVDIAKVQVGNKAVVKLDAYGKDTVFDVVVKEIDPAETIVDSVATYKVKFDFLAEDKRIRSGMTADIFIVTAQRDDVLSVPQRVILTEDGFRTVQLAPAGPDAEPVRREVQIGLRGSDGMVEIIDGLSEGETIVVGTKQ